MLNEPTVQPPFPRRELELQITASLAAHHVPSLRHVKVLVEGHTIVLRGQVNTFYAKQLCQHTARRLAGDSQIIDEVSVVTPASFRDPSRLKSAAAGVFVLDTNPLPDPIAR